MIIIILLIWEFITPALADDFPLESGWKQVSSNLQNSPQYSGQSQQCCSMDGLHSPFNFQVFQFLYQSIGDCTSVPITIGIAVTFMFHSFSIF